MPVAFYFLLNSANKEVLEVECLERKGKHKRKKVENSDPATNFFYPKVISIITPQ